MARAAADKPRADTLYQLKLDVVDAILKSKGLDQAALAQLTPCWPNRTLIPLDQLPAIAAGQVDGDLLWRLFEGLRTFPSCPSTWRELVYGDVRLRKFPLSIAQLSKRREAVGLRIADVVSPNTHNRWMDELRAGRVAYARRDTLETIAKRLSKAEVPTDWRDLVEIASLEDSLRRPFVAILASMQAASSATDATPFVRSPNYARLHHHPRFIHCLCASMESFLGCFDGKATVEQVRGWLSEGWETYHRTMEAIWHWYVTGDYSEDLFLDAYYSHVGPFYDALCERSPRGAFSAGRFECPDRYPKDKHLQAFLNIARRPNAAHYHALRPDPELLAILRLARIEFDLADRAGDGQRDMC